VLTPDSFIANISCIYFHEVSKTLGCVRKVKIRVDGNFSNDFDQEFRRKGGEVVVVLRGRHGENVRCRSVDGVAVLSVQFRRKSLMTVAATGCLTAGGV
jgi:hypothetical protein